MRGLRRGASRTSVTQPSGATASTPMPYSPISGSNATRSAVLGGRARNERSAKIRFLAACAAPPVGDLRLDGDGLREDLLPLGREHPRGARPRQRPGPRQVVERLLDVVATQLASVGRVEG